MILVVLGIGVVLEVLLDVISMKGLRVVGALSGVVKVLFGVLLGVDLISRVGLRVGRVTSGLFLGVLRGIFRGNFRGGQSTFWGSIRSRFRYKGCSECGPMSDSGSRGTFRGSFRGTFSDQRTFRGR